MSEDMHPPDKAALLKVICQERGHLESLLKDIDDSQKVEPGVETIWSIKDIMAHISSWERLAQDRIHAAQTGEPLRYPVIKGDEFVDIFNSQTYEANKEIPLAEITSGFQASYQDFIAQIQNLDNDFIHQKLPFDWAKNLTVQVLISANTHWHYIEHANSIEKWRINQGY